MTRAPANAHDDIVRRLAADGFTAREIAAAIDRSPARVHQIAIRLGIEIRRMSPPRWMMSEVALLAEGKDVPGRSEQARRHQRRRQGLTSPTQWLPAEEALLHLPTAEVARRTGRTLNAVRVHRWVVRQRDG